MKKKLISGLFLMLWMALLIAAIVTSRFFLG